ncbi:MAG: respiratory nitrate reductase subunit gamma [Candidatus Zixiibacteriota bacterium]
MTLLQLLMYLALVVFIIGTVYKAIKITRMPVHLRWDLYPIPHEKGREHYGGSYYEEIDWWTKPAAVSISTELREMAKEIFFIQSMFNNNRPLWIFSFPFHLGLYLSIVFVLLVYFGALLQLLGIDVTASAGGPGKVVYALTPVFGLAGAVLAAVGCFGLLLSRIFNKNLRLSSVRADYFNLLLLLAVFVTSIIAGATVDTTFAGMRGFIRNLISLQAAAPLPGIVVVHIVLSAIFLLWLPFTHMMHFVGKYFTYHRIRWEDHPNIQGGELERAITDALGYKINWSAPHIKKGATWAEAAMDNAPKEEDNK